MYNINTVQAMTFDGHYLDSKTDMDQTSFSLHAEEVSIPGRFTGSPRAGPSQIKRRKSLGGHVGRIILVSLTPVHGFYFPCVYYI